MNSSLGQNPFTAKTEENAQRIMELRSECRVLRCVFPTMCATSYYISECGELYGCRYNRTKRIFDAYEISKCKARKYLCYELKYRKDANSTTINAERLVYCTFVLGEWNEDIKIAFKDGDRFNINVGNLCLKEDKLNTIAANRMTDWTAIYRKEFKRVAQDVKYHCSIEIEDAYDIVQDSFLNLMERSNWNRDLDFVALWIVNSRKLGINFHKHQARSISMQADGVENDASMTMHTISYEVDLLSPISGNMRKIVELKMQDVSEACIAKELGLACSSIGPLYGRARKILRQYWSRDKELCKFFCQNPKK